MPRTRYCEAMFFLMLWTDIPDVVTGMSVTDFTTVGHIAMLTEGGKGRDAVCIGSAISHPMRTDSTRFENSVYPVSI